MTIVQNRTIKQHNKANPLTRLTLQSIIKVYYTTFYPLLCKAFIFDLRRLNYKVDISVISRAISSIRPHRMPQNAKGGVYYIATVRQLGH